MLVRITNTRGVNLNFFDFDYDLTWSGLFMNADAHTYGRFGGRDAGPAEAHLTVLGLRYAMRRALDAYHSDPNAPGPSAAPPRTAEQYPAAKVRGAKGCIHCHHIYEFSRDALRRAGRWQGEMAWVYPWPENVGMTMDLNQPDILQSVKADSAAYAAGLRAGDRLQTLNGYPIASYADVQYALHRAPTQGTIPILWKRDGEEHTAQMVVPRGWRETDLSWRNSMWRLSPAPSVEGEDLPSSEKVELGLPANSLAFRQYTTVWPEAKKAGIQPGDIIFGVDDKPFAMTMLRFLIYIRVHYRVGDRVVFNLFRDGRRMDIPMTLGVYP